jgi:acyl-CoA thioesterase FadM
MATLIQTNAFSRPDVSSMAQTSLLPWVVQLLLAGTFVFLLTTAKGLPLAYTLRLLPSVYRLFRPRFFSKPNSATVIAKSTQESTIIAASPGLFQYEVANSRVVLLDLDISMHKSSSTFLTDADISRAALLTKLLSPSLARLGPASFILAAVQCNFKRPIAPWQAYRVSSRILAWDEQSLYLVTYFTKPDTKKLQTGLDLCGGPVAVLKDKVVSKGLFATLVTRYVFKAGQTTVRPVHILLEAGLLLSGDGGGEASALGIAEVREGVERGLEYARNSMV